MRDDINGPTFWAVKRTRAGSRVALALLAASLLSQNLPAADAVSPIPPSLFEQHCFVCHGEGVATAGINLADLTSHDSIADDFLKWKKIAAVLEQNQMPPEGMPQPSEDERIRAVNWVRTELKQAAEKDAGDPGRVTVRRLTSAEYAYTVKDLTGLDLDTHRLFADDAVGGEGFTNFGDVQFIEDSSLERYLEAAKLLADHAVIGSGPLEFFEDPGMSGFELSAIHRIHDIYRRHGFRAVAAEGGRAFGLERYSKAFFAAWRYLHRDKLGEKNVSLAELAVRENLSDRFIDHIWSVLRQTSPTFPTSEVVSQWRALPAPQGPLSSSAETDMRARCEEIQKFVINWPRQLFAAGELAAGGAGDERALVITDASLKSAVSHSLRFTSVEREEKPVGSLYLSILPVNPGAKGAQLVTWRNATVRVLQGDRKRGPEQPLSSMVDAETAEKLAFGRRPDGGAIAPNDFVTAGETNLNFDIKLPEGVRGLELTVDVEVDVETSNDAVLRCTISDRKDSALGTPVWALLADPESESFKTWKSNVLEYAANLPQTSHGEPTPSDRDPIPEPFDNTYNQPERDRFHFRVKYFRDDNFVVDKMLDDATRVKLDQAWLDLRASFEFHEAILDFIKDRFELSLGEKGIADLEPADIEALPALAREYVQPLRADFDAVMASQASARPRHLVDTLAFASRAWRRPLSDQEKDRLRSFYVKATEEFDLDHRQAIRAVLARILVAPEFLYRIEQPQEVTGVEPLSDWEIAGRLSYFLWSSAPDGELRRAAAAGELRDTENIARQVRRMLADSRARRLSTEFFGQWLGFYRFDQYRGVDSTRFPEFTDAVKAGMYNEAVYFFEHIIRKQRPIREIISADYTFLNKPLAEHYGIETEIKSEREPVLVEGAGEFHRGGLLRLGAVLTATSAPLRTSPVKRGDWLLRRVIGTPTPPPPPDVGSIPADPNLFGGMTVQQRLKSHQRNATCASCHSRIDPLGFPLEHFDAVGRWRDQYSENQPIEDTATLYDKTTIAGIDGLLDYLDAQQSQVLRTMSGKLLGFALGRTILVTDQPLIERLVAGGGQATFSDLAIEIATSRQFLYRRGRNDGHTTDGDNLSNKKVHHAGN